MGHNEGITNQRASGFTQTKAMIYLKSFPVLFENLQGKRQPYNQTAWSFLAAP